MDIEFVKKYVPLFFQIAKFGIIGVLNTAIDFAVLNFLAYFFNTYAGWQTFLFNSVSFSAAATNSYFWNKHWTFKSQTEAKPKEFFQFFAVSAGGILINGGIIYFLTTFVNPFFNLPPALWLNAAKIAATLASLVWNFVGYKYVVFK